MSEKELTVERQISPQQKWHEEQRAKGCCIRCGKPAAKSTRAGLSQYCEMHRERYRSYMRQYMRRKAQQ